MDRDGLDEITYRPTFVAALANAISAPSM